MSGQLDATSDASRSMISTQTRLLQIIVCSLITGVLLFTGFVIWSGALRQPPGGRMLTYLAVGMGMVMAVLHVVVPGLVERAALANQAVGSGVQSLLGVYVIRTIIAAALLEGAAFTSVVAVMIEHHQWVLGVTVVLLVLMIMQIPSSTRIEHWLESRLMERDVATS